MISDIIIILIIVIFTIVGARRGIAKTLLNIAALAAAYILSAYLSDLLSDLIYDSFLKQSVTENISNFLSESGAQYAIDNCLASLPDPLCSLITGIFSLFGGSLESFLSYAEVEYATAADAAVGTIEPMVRTAATSVLGVILLVILFIILFILLRKLSKLVSKLFEIPVIRGVNSFFGGVLGAVYGLAAAFAAANAAGVLLICCAPDFINNDMIVGGIFKVLCFTI